MNISPGDKVIVCDGKPKPPRHHSRKRADWKYSNFVGTVDEIDHGRIYVINDEKSDDHVTIIRGCRPEHVFPSDQVKPEVMERIAS